MVLKIWWNLHFESPRSLAWSKLKSIETHHLSSVGEGLCDLFTGNEAGPYFSGGFLKRGMCQLPDLSPWMKPQANSLSPPSSLLPSCFFSGHLCVMLPLPDPLQVAYLWVNSETSNLKDTQIIGPFSKGSVPCAPARFLPNEYIQWQWDSWAAPDPWENELPCFVTACGSGGKRNDSHHASFLWM